MLKYKKEGFTLAEVLITLTVIGVIAALTIPALLQDIQDREFRTAWRGAYSIVNQANSKALMEYGGDFTGIFSDRDDMKDKLKGYFSYVKECADGESEGNCWPAVFYNEDGAPSGLTDVPGIVLNNGMFLRFYVTTNGSTCTETEYYNTPGECGLYELDINGFRGPNKFGKDIYFIHILKDHMRSAGVAESADPDWRVCFPSGGLGCGAYHLRQ